MIGIDIVSIKKFNKKKLIKKIFTENEIAYAKSKVNMEETLAGIFAAKESIIKAHRLNLYYILRKKIEILHIENAPLALLKGQKLDDHISISHDGDYALGVCINREDVVEIDSKMKNILPKRNHNSHKGSYGRIGILGGSPGMAGSVYMSSLASMRSGAGLTYIISPESISDILAIKSNEQIIKSIPCQKFSFSEKILNQILMSIKNLDVLALGPGMGNGENLHILVEKIIRQTNIKYVIDADGLNAISMNLSILNSNNEIVLTPHIGEFSRLSGFSIDEINNDRENIAKNFAKENKLVLVLKCDQTIVTDGNRIYVNKIGNPGMATAGSGDVLTGIIASLLHRLSSYDAALLGVYLHSLSGDLAAKNLGEESLIATDIINHLPHAFKLLRK